MFSPNHSSVWTSLSQSSFRLRFAEVDGWRTRILEAGAGDTVVLMHGTGGHLEAYSRNIAALSQRFHVVAYDYPGHGYSQLTDRDLELPDYVSHLVALLDHLGVERAHLNGESLGGWIAIKAAAQHPARVGSIVLNTPGGTMATAEVMERIRSLSQAAADDPTESLVRARLEWLMADPASVTPELIAVRQAIYSQPGFAASMRGILCLQDLETRRRNMVTDDELGSISTPALVVWTSDDPSGPAATGLHMARTIPGGRFELIEGAGHWPQWEQAGRFNELVLGFLSP
jgi:2-hydroxy-6-oxonona-2,4-dienedioate hydrolase